jgi:O-antigen/teichoic acid export membrane protein
MYSNNWNIIEIGGVNRVMDILFKTQSLFIRSRIEGSEKLHRVLANIACLLGDRILRMGTGVFVGRTVARYLGSENFVVLNYAISLIGIYAVFCSLDLDGIVTRELIGQPERHGYILTTTLCFVFPIAGSFPTLPI